MLKKCKVCASEFHSYFPSQSCCSYQCGEKLDRGESLKFQNIEEISARGVNYGGIVLNMQK